MKRILITPLLFFLFQSIHLHAQVPNGPGGVENTSGSSNLRMWYKAETGVTLTGGLVSTWADQSGYGNNLTGPAGFRASVATSAALNNQTVMRYSGAQYFTSGITGPATNSLTVFIVANGTSYQSLIRFQNNAGTYVVYPWEFGGAARTFISSSDGGTGSGIASGLATSANNVGAARYRRNTTNGMQTYLNGSINSQRNSANAVLPSQPFYSGRYNPGASEYPNCDVGEMMVFYTALNDAQMIIVQNYLAAKYNVGLASNDFYTMDNAGNGNYDFDVAGIGRVDASNIHNDAQGTGIVRINTPSSLGNGDYLFWGHDNGTLSANNTTDIPAGVQARLGRVWRVSETGEVGTVTVSFDLTGLGSVTAGDLRLLVDTDNDGQFSDETAGTGGLISGATAAGGNVYQFTLVSALEPSVRFTLGTINTTQTPLPIELALFNAEPCSRHVCLDWITLSEQNNKEFTIERSKDGSVFEEVSRIAGAGTTSIQQSYFTADEDPYEGISYYRLKQTDFDNSFTYSEVKMVNMEIAEPWLIFPNPLAAHNAVTFQTYAAIRAGAQVTIYDISGHVVRRFFLYTNSLTVDPDLPAGSYVAELVNGNIVKRQQLIIQ